MRTKKNELAFPDAKRKVIMVEKPILWTEVKDWCNWPRYKTLVVRGEQQFIIDCASLMYGEIPLYETLILIKQGDKYLIFDHDIGGCYEKGEGVVEKATLETMKELEDLTDQEVQDRIDAIIDM